LHRIAGLLKNEDLFVARGWKLGDDLGARAIRCAKEKSRLTTKAQSHYDIMNRIKRITRGALRWARVVMASKIPTSASIIGGGGGGRLRFAEKRRQAAALQNAGARATRRVGGRRSTAATDVSTSAFIRFRRDMQVADISPKEAKMSVVSRLISRLLRRKPAFFDPFLTRKGVDFPPLTKIPPDFYFQGRWGKWAN
jgi:hypothetical protein